ncbi:MAG: hypothetical protein JXB10_17155 [Pirellulales bacterium]|nr:hypothetical protein [Pirellulales bacterium]
MRISPTRIGVFAVALLVAADPGYPQKLRTGKGLSPPSRRPPVVGKIGWWNYQDWLEIDDFQVQVVNANLGALNAKSSVRLHISGTFRRPENAASASIKEVYVSERFLGPNREAVDLLIIPVVEVRSEKIASRRSDSFRLAIDYELNSYKWGENRYVFRCGKFQKHLKFIQDKVHSIHQPQWAEEKEPF